MNSLVSLPIVAALPVAAPAMDFPIAPVAAPSPADVELVDLANQLIAAAAESRRLNKIVDDMDGVRFACQPPAGMEIRSGDVELGIPLPDQIGKHVERCGYYGAADVNKMRQSKRMDCEKSGEDDDNFIMAFRNVTPSAETRARADEIVAAYDAWEAARERKPRGYRKAKRAYNKAERIETEIEKKIHLIQATTIIGMTAKARCAELYYFDGGVFGDFSTSIAQELLALGADAPAAADLGAGPVAAQTPPSEALALVERCRKGDRRWTVLADKIDAAEEAARSVYGRRPIALIAWRNYSHIGGSEIERARDEFLRDGIDEKLVRSEYRLAKSIARPCKQSMIGIVRLASAISERSTKI